MSFTVVLDNVKNVPYTFPMSITEIETAITQLSRDELAELLTWLAAYHAQVWDQQIEDDLAAGRLDSLLAEVDAEYQAGLAQPL